MASRILPGSEQMDRYPGQDWNDSKGILTYGRTNGAYKIPLRDYERITVIGYRLVKTGTSYAFVEPL